MNLIYEDMVNTDGRRHDFCEPFDDTRSRDTCGRDRRVTGAAYHYIEADIDAAAAAAGAADNLPLQRPCYARRC